jgi:hypothetical protein
MTQCAGEGRKWWTNGKENVLKVECPDGFKAGMTKTISDEGRSRISESMKKAITGRRRWTDGKTTVCCVECPGKDWYLGVILSEDAKNRQRKGLRIRWERNLDRDKSYPNLFPI